MASLYTVFNVAVGVATIGAALLAFDCQIWGTVCKPSEFETASLPEFSGASSPNEIDAVTHAPRQDEIQSCLEEQLQAHALSGHTPSYAVCSDWPPEIGFRSELTVAYGNPSDYGELQAIPCLNPDQIDVSLRPNYPAAAVLCNYPWNLSDRDPDRIQSHAIARFFHSGHYTAATTILANGEYLWIQNLEYTPDQNTAVLTFTTDASEIWTENGISQLNVQAAAGEQVRGRMMLIFTTSGRLSDLRLIEATAS